MTALHCHAVETEGMFTFLRRSTHGVLQWLYTNLRPLSCNFSMEIITLLLGFAHTNGQYWRWDLMKLWRATIFTLLLSGKLSGFNTLNYKPAFLYTLETCSLKVTTLSIVIPSNLTESSFSNIVLCSVKVGSVSCLVLLRSFIINFITTSNRTYHHPIWSWQCKTFNFPAPIAHVPRR